jgi:AcrR family transcriptional regulator
MRTSEPTAESPSRVQRRQKRNRAALVKAARRLFARNGFEPTTIADIAEAADLGFGTFYLYFASKEALLEAALDDGIAEIAKALQAPEIAAMPADEALATVSRRYIHLIRSHRSLLAELLNQVFEGIIQRGVSEGAFTIGDAGIAAGAIAGMHIQLLFSTEGGSDEEPLLQTLPALALGGLRHAGDGRRQGG